MDRLESFGHLRDVDTEKSRITAVISTGDVARDGAIIDPSGWDFTNYDRNPVVLWMHDADSMPFARTVERTATEKELIARAEFDLEDPMGAQVFRKIANGYINATSVRWLPKKTELRPKEPAHGVGVEVKGKQKEEEDEKVLWFLEQELLEWSFVTIPADPGALILRADGSPFSVADYTVPPFVPDLAWLRLIGPNIDLSWLRELELWRPDQAQAYMGCNGNGDLKALEGLLLRYLERRGKQRDPDEMFVDALSRATGKTPERIRREMAEGGAK